MKRELYNLANEELAFFVDRLHKQMEKEEIPYILVGGTAIQAHVLQRLSNKTGKNLSDLTLNPEIRLQDYIRSTDDLDLAISSSVLKKYGEVGFNERINRVLSGLQVNETVSPSEEFLLNYKLIRKGIKRPRFQIYVDGEGNDEMQIAMNIGRSKKDLQNLNSDNYDLFVEKGQILQVPFNPNFTINTRVIKPEHLIANKVARFRAKDTMDIHSLADIMRDCGEKLDLTEIKKLLFPTYDRNYERFLDLADLNNNSL
jgi:hypothetical protein